MLMCSSSLQETTNFLSNIITNIQSNITDNGAQNTKTDQKLEELKKNIENKSLTITNLEQTIKKKFDNFCDNFFMHNDYSNKSNKPNSNNEPKIEPIKNNKETTPNIFNKFGQFVGGAIDKGAQTIDNITDKVSHTISDTKDKIEDVIDDGKKKFNDTVNEIKQDLNNTKEEIKNEYNNFKEKVDKNLNTLNLTTQFLIQNQKKTNQSIGNSVATFFTGVGEGLVSGCEKIQDGAMHIGSMMMIPGATAFDFLNGNLSVGISDFIEDPQTSALKLTTELGDKVGFDIFSNKTEEANNILNSYLINPQTGAYNVNSAYDAERINDAKKTLSNIDGLRTEIAEDTMFKSSFVSSLIEETSKNIKEEHTEKLYDELKFQVDKKNKEEGTFMEIDSTAYNITKNISEQIPVLATTFVTGGGTAVAAPLAFLQADGETMESELQAGNDYFHSSAKAVGYGGIRAGMYIIGGAINKIPINGKTVFSSSLQLFGKSLLDGVTGATETPLRAFWDSFVSDKDFKTAFNYEGGWESTFIDAVTGTTLGMITEIPSIKAKPKLTDDLDIDIPNVKNGDVPSSVIDFNKINAQKIEDALTEYGIDTSIIKQKKLKKYFQENFKFDMNTPTDQTYFDIFANVLGRKQLPNDNVKNIIENIDGLNKIVKESSRYSPGFTFNVIDDNSAQSAIKPQFWEGTDGIIMPKKLLEQGVEKCECITLHEFGHGVYNYTTKKIKNSDFYMSTLEKGKQNILDNNSEKVCDFLNSYIQKFQQTFDSKADYYMKNFDEMDSKIISQKINELFDDSNLNELKKIATTAHPDNIKANLARRGLNLEDIGIDGIIQNKDLIEEIAIRQNRYEKVLKETFNARHNFDEMADESILAKMLNSITQNEKIKFKNGQEYDFTDYGDYHSNSYWKTDDVPQPYVRSFDELQADFFALNAAGRTEALNKFKELVGDEVYNMLDDNLNEMAEIIAKKSTLLNSHSNMSQLYNVNKKSNPLFYETNINTKNNIKTGDAFNDDIIKFSKKPEIAIEQMGKHYGDAGEDIRKKLADGKTIPEILEELTGETRQKFQDFLDNTQEGQFLSKLNSDQIDSILSYTGTGSGTLNKIIRGQSLMKKVNNYFGEDGNKIIRLLATKKTIPGVLEELTGETRQKFQDFLDTQLGEELSTLNDYDIDIIFSFNKEIKTTVSGEKTRFIKQTAKAMIDNIDSAIYQYGGLKEKTQLYRAIPTNTFLNTEYKKLFQDININDLNEVYAALKTLEGKPFADSAYMSTSPSYNTSFATYNNYDIVLDIEADKGTKAAYINQISGAYNVENEVLLARDTKLKIVEVSMPEMDVNGREKIIVKCVVDDKI